MRHMLGLLAAVVILLGTAVAARGQEESFLNLPEEASVLRTLRSEHPRLLATAADWQRIARLVEEDDLHADWYAEVRSEADKILDRPVSEYVIPDGKRLLATSRRVFRRVVTLGFVYRLEGGERYRERLWSEVEAAANFQDWNPSHFLDTAEMTAALGLAYDWLYHDWTDEQCAILRQAIVKHGLEPALRCYSGESTRDWWVRTDNNWNQVCNGGIALGALAIADEQPDLARTVLVHGLRSVRIAMRKFAPDGGCEEGPGYWHYATSYNVLHIAALETALGTDFGLSRYPGFDVTPEFPMYMAGATGRTYNYADASARVIRAPQMYWFAERFRRPDYAAYQDAVAQPTALDLLWRRPVEGDAKEPALDRYFRGVEAATMRSAWHDPDALFIGFKGGDNSASHGHLDLGSFVLEALGVRWAVDLGGDDYNMPGYFGGKRWTYYRLRAEGHNTLLIAPDAGPDQRPQAKAEILKFRHGPHEPTALIDLTSAYSDAAERVQRQIKLTHDRSRALVRDGVTADPGTPIWWFMHTEAEIQVDADDPALAVLSVGDARLEARVLEPDGAAFRVLDARPLGTSPDPEMQRQNEDIRKLAIKLEAVEGLTRISVSLRPYRVSD